MGAATSQDHINAARERREQEQREAEEEAELQANAPPVPYKTDTTGLSTTGLPPPPKFRGEGVASPPAGRPTPSLPPRLPARASAGPPPPYQEAAPARPDKGILNQGALNRLGKAGVNVQGFGIGNNHASARPAPALPNKRSQVLELTSSNFDGAVFRPGKATLVDFYAPFCKYCKEFDSVLEELAASYGSVQNQITFAKVDAHKYTDIKARYGIEGYPTIMLFDGSSDAPEQFQWKRDLEWLQRFIREQTEIEPSASSAPATAPAQAQAQASPSSGMGFGGQMSELQARFARMGSNSSNGQTAPLPTAASFPASPTKKRPPPPPPKKKELHGAPPPVPLASKPR